MTDATSTVDDDPEIEVDGPLAADEVGDDGEAGGAPRHSRPAVGRVLDNLSALDADTVAMVLGCALAVLVTWWLISGIWNPGVPTGDDTSAHLVRTQYALDHLYPRGQLDGWQTSFGLGYQEFLFIGPLFTIGAGLIHGLTLGTVSTLDSFKLMIVLSYCLIPISAAVLTCAFGLGRRAAGLTAILAVGVNSYAGGVGIDSVFKSGLVANHLGTTFVFLSLAGFVWLLRGPTPRRVLFAGLSFGVLVMTHGIGAIITLILGIAIVIAAGIEWLVRHRSEVRETRRALLAISRDEAGAQWIDDAEDDELPPPVLLPIARRVGALVLAGAMAFGLGAFVLVPVVLHGDLRGFNTAYPDAPLPEVLASVWRGDFLYMPFVSMFVLLGMVLLALRWRSGASLKLALVIAPVIYLVIAHLLITMFPGTSLALQLTGRSYAYLAVLCLLPLAGVIGAPQRQLGRVLTILGVRHRRVREPMLDVAQVLPIFVALALLWMPGKLGDLRKTATTTKPTAAILEVAEVLHREVPEHGRFVMQRAFPKEMTLTGMSHPDFWLPWKADRNTLNIYNVESSTVYDPAYEAENLLAHPPAEEAVRLARFGVTHVFLIDAPAAPALLASPAFDRIWSRDSMAILRVRRPDAATTTGDPTSLVMSESDARITARVNHLDPEHLELRVDTDRDTTASVAIAWSPKWHVEVNGVEEPAQATTDKLLRITVPAGGADVRLSYGPDRIDALARLITIATIAGLIGGAVVLRRRRSVPAPTSA